MAGGERELMRDSSKILPLFISQALLSPLYKRERKGRPSRARGGHHLLQQGAFELMAGADFR
jgi:hypothetical protein